MTTRTLPVLALAVVVSACSSLTVSPPVARPADCVNPPPNVATVISQADPLACYGGADLTFAAFAAGGGAVSCPGDLEPAWFDCYNQIELFPLPGEARLPAVVLAARSNGPSMTAVLHPLAEEFRGRLFERSVTLTGHLDDPAAQECVINSWPDADRPTPEEVILGCRTRFVITDVTPLDG